MPATRPCAAASARPAAPIRSARRATVLDSLKDERALLNPFRSWPTSYIDTSKLNVHELRALITSKFQSSEQTGNIVVYVNSFGFRHGVPTDSDLVFDVRFLPNPNYIPEFKKLSGRHPSVARYIRSFPQTLEFIRKFPNCSFICCPTTSARANLT